MTMMETMETPGSLTRTPAIIAGEINLIKEQVRSTALQASIEIGRRLTEAQALVPRGSWVEWLQTNVDYSVRTAQNLMALAAECDAGRGAALEKFPYSKAVLLLSVPEDEREDFVDSHDVDGMSVRELKAQLDQLKEKNNKLQISMDELLSEQNADQSAAEGMKAEIADLKEQLAKATQAVEQAKEMSRGIQQQNKEAADKLRKDLKAAQDETAQAKRDLKAAQAEAETEKQQLQKALKDAGQPVIQQVTPPDVLQELEALRAKAARSEEEQVLRGTYELLRHTFDRLMERLAEMETKDADLAGRFRGAFAVSLRKMAEGLVRP